MSSGPAWAKNVSTNKHGTRTRGSPFLPMAESLSPGLLLACGLCETEESIRSVHW